MIQFDRTKNAVEILALPFAVDIDKVKQVFGSKNESLFLRIQQTNLFQFYYEKLSFKRELYDIIFNYVPIEERVVAHPKFFGLIKPKDTRGLEGEWNDYGHALLSICGYIGTHLFSEDNVFSYSEPWWKINTLLRENNSPLNLERMLECCPIFDTPLDDNGISCNYYDKNEVKILLSYVIKIESKIEKEDLKLVKFYTTFKEGLEYCTKNNYDLISFSYEQDDLD